MQSVMKKFVFVFITMIALTFSAACNKDHDPLTIAVTPANPTAQADVLFESSQSGSGWSYYWDFGDGNVNTTNNSYVHHTYLQPGNYSVSLSVSHNGNPLGTCSQVDIVQ